jgi:hypothetical protein
LRVCTHLHDALCAAQIPHFTEPVKGDGSQERAVQGVELYAVDGLPVCA